MADDIFSSSKKKPTNVVLTKLETPHDYFELVKCDNSNRIFIDRWKISQQERQL